MCNLKGFFFLCMMCTHFGKVSHVTSHCYENQSLSNKSANRPKIQWWYSTLVHEENQISLSWVAFCYLWYWKKGDEPTNMQLSNLWNIDEFNSFFMCTHCGDINNIRTKYKKKSIRYVYSSWECEQKYEIMFYIFNIFSFAVGIFLFNSPENGNKNKCDFFFVIIF